jgi:hypothetical protein
VACRAAWQIRLVPPSPIEMAYDHDTAPRCMEPNDPSDRHLDKAAVAFIDWRQHFDRHDQEWIDHWLSQTVAVRLAAAQLCRLRVDGPPRPIDRSRLGLVSSHDDGERG